MFEPPDVRYLKERSPAAKLLAPVVGPWSPKTSLPKAILPLPPPNGWSPSLAKINLLLPKKKHL